MALKLREQVAALGTDAGAPGSVGVATRCGRALIDANRLDDAAHLFGLLGEQFPRQPVGPVGLAHVATRREAWAEALERWDECARRFPGIVQPDWTAARSRALAGLGRPEAATPVTSAPHPVATAIVPATPAVPAIPRGPMQMGTDAFGQAALRVNQLLRATRIVEAREALPEALAEARESHHFRAVLMMIPPLLEGWQRTDALLRLREGLATHAPGFPASRKREGEAVELRICLALRDYTGFMAGYGRLAQQGTLPAEDAVLGTIAAKLADRTFPDFMAEKVFCIGAPKTGTTSFTAALKMLGYHAIHWTNPATHELFCDDDLFLFDAFADLPVNEHFEQFYFMFPNAKFVYTIRAYESWEKSYLAHMNASGNESLPAQRRRALRRVGAPWGTQLARMSLAMFYNHPTVEEAYASYDRRVRGFFDDKPAGRFMEFNLGAGHGWTELCGFLNRPVPDLPYPRKNPQANKKGRGDNRARVG